MIEHCQHLTSTVGGLKYSSNKASVLRKMKIAVKETQSLLTYYNVKDKTTISMNKIMCSHVTIHVTVLSGVCLCMFLYDHRAERGCHRT
jgi:hypothetical protein